MDGQGRAGDTAHSRISVADGASAVDGVGAAAGSNQCSSPNMWPDLCEANTTEETRRRHGAHGNGSNTSRPHRMNGTAASLLFQLDFLVWPFNHFYFWLFLSFLRNTFKLILVLVIVK
ncbi:uncharacterized protein V6R79_000681 [Siganus canaliculatus]